MSSLARSVFSFLVRLHPQEFRRDFGGEMLWIFNESMDRTKPGIGWLGVCGHLLLDVFRSALLQHFMREPTPDEAGGAMFVQIDSSGLVVRTVQGTFLVLACLCTAFNIVLFLYMTTQ